MSVVGISGPIGREQPRTAVGGALRLLATGSLWAAAGVLFGVCAAVTVPYLLGYRSLTVMSGSMEPTLRVGDVVVIDQISPVQAKIGDVVTFRDPADTTRLITHRVRDIAIADGVVKFVTKGDANTSVDHWKIPSTGTIGRVTYHVPRIGYALFWIRGRFGRLLLVVLPALLLGVYELWRIWRPRRDDVEDLEEANVDAAA